MFVYECTLISSFIPIFLAQSARKFLLLDRETESGGNFLLYTPNYGAEFYGKETDKVNFVSRIPTSRYWMCLCILCFFLASLPVVGYKQIISVMDSSQGDHPIFSQI
ncbi:uncharacterized protein BJX67DRAFT_144434 [Aspergillus lucknowensis]|uniref:Uncharacterized protein n=1 Tax=Aspergillus lucknowensis TaxID=176173 RepID=A0ABR4LP44_9EURO